MTTTKKKYTVFATFSVMIIIALTETTRGLLIPFYKETFLVGDTQIGILLLLSTLSFVLGTYISGYTSEKFGNKVTVIVGLIISGLCFFFLSKVNTFIILTIIYTILGYGIGKIVLGLNTTIPLLKLSAATVIMNTLHFFYGFGAGVSQKVSGILLKNNMDFRTLLLIYSSLYIIAIVIFIFTYIPKFEHEEGSDKKIKKDNIKMLVFFCMSLGFYIAAEIQTANWVINYLKFEHSFDTESAASVLSYFFIALGLGRLFGGYIVEKFNKLQSIIVSFSVAFILYSICLLLNNHFYIISLSGLFFGIIYPTTILAISDIFKNNPIKAVSIVTTAGSIINMGTSYLIGRLNDLIGLKTTYYIIVVFILISTIFYILILREIKLRRRKA